MENGVNIVLAFVLEPWLGVEGPGLRLLRWPTGWAPSLALRALDRAPAARRTRRWDGDGAGRARIGAAALGMAVAVRLALEALPESAAGPGQGGRSAWWSGWPPTPSALVAAPPAGPGRPRRPSDRLATAPGATDGAPSRTLRRRYRGIAVEALAADRVLGGRYRLRRELARGGMATVWEAEDKVLTRRVAIKVLHPHLAGDDGFRTRFRREAIAAARLAHPNIVTTYDTGRDADVAYIVMELVEGITLARLLKCERAAAPRRRPSTSPSRWPTPWPAPTPTG